MLLLAIVPMCMLSAIELFLLQVLETSSCRGDAAKIFTYLPVCLFFAGAASSTSCYTADLVYVFVDPLDLPRLR